VHQHFSGGAFGNGERNIGIRQIFLGKFFLQKRKCIECNGRHGQSPLMSSYPIAKIFSIEKYNSSVYM
jgi:hypothetical protein